jgi:tetratricopeptide (TPR) repeat protein
LYAAIFADNPNLADDRATGHRYNASCFAVTAAAGQGDDVAQLGEAERAALRARALTWLQSDLAAMKQLLDPNTRPNSSGAADALETKAIRDVLHWWTKDKDLSYVRGDAIETLPEPERAPWRAFWTDVQTLANPMDQQPVAASINDLTGAEALHSIHMRAHALEESDLEEAERLFRRALDGYTTMLGSESELTLELTSDLARVLSQTGRIDQALPLVQNVLEIRQRTQGSYFEDNLQTQFELGRLFSMQGQFERSEQELTKVVELTRQKYGADHSISIEQWRLRTCRAAFD